MEFDLLCKEYAPIIKDLINKNVAFYRFKETIKWCFGLDEDISIVGSCNRKTDVITINLNAVIKAYIDKDLKTIEYFLLHEIRHVYQHLIIKDYESGLDIPIDKSIVEKWIYEGKNYTSAKDKEGNINTNYFLQDSEMDAYAFTYSVMKYKYGNIDVYIPPMYGSEFYSIVDEWIKAFKKENL